MSQSKGRRDEALRRDAASLQGAPGGVVELGESEGRAAPHVVETWRLISEMIDHVGIAIEDASPAVKRLVARKIINVDAELKNSVHSYRDTFCR